MRGLVLELDALPALRDAVEASEVDLPAAATLAELAGAHAVRLGVSLDQKPVRAEDLRDVRRASRRLELRMAPVEALARIALEVRPESVLLAADRREGRCAATPLDFRHAAKELGGVMRALGHAGIDVSLLVPPTLEAVKAAHGAGASQVELYTGALVDLPRAQRDEELSRMGDAGRLASKMGLGLGLGGGLGYRSLPDVIEAAPAAGRVAVGRAALSRALLVGLDRALRDLRALLA